MVRYKFFELAVMENIIMTLKRRFKQNIHLYILQEKMHKF